MDVKILVIEDDEEINKMICDFFIDIGYHVDTAYTGLDGLIETQKKKYDIILLDLMLPKISGEEFLKKIKFNNINMNTPIIILSGKERIPTLVNTMTMGADDYISKPFDWDELLARVCAQLRNSKKLSRDQKAILQVSDLLLNEDTKEVLCNGSILNLTNIEFKILSILMKNPRKIYDHYEILNKIWNENSENIIDNTLSVHISNLRKKLKDAHKEKKYIKTHHGKGFSMIL